MSDSEKLEHRKLALEQEKAAHARWWQEDTLVNQRLTWLLQSQGLLFAGYGLLVTRGPGENGSDALKAALPWIGISVSSLISIGISAAWRAQEMLKARYSQDGVQVGVSSLTTRSGRLPAGILPFVFIAGWGWVLCSLLGTISVLVGSAALIFVTKLALEAYDEKQIWEPRSPLALVRFWDSVLRRRQAKLRKSTQE